MLIVDVNNRKMQEIKEVFANHEAFSKCEVIMIKDLGHDEFRVMAKRNDGYMVCTYSDGSCYWGHYDLSEEIALRVLSKGVNYRCEEEKWVGVAKELVEMLEANVVNSEYGVEEFEEELLDSMKNLSPDDWDELGKKEIGDIIRKREWEE